MPSVDEKVSCLSTEDGYHVVSRSEGVVELERKNSWLSVLIHGVLSGGGPTTFRRERIYVPEDELGEAIVRLHPPRED